MTDGAGTVFEAIRRWAERLPDAPALVAEGRPPMTYGALAAAAAEFQRALNASGFGRGDRIAMVHPGGVDMALALVGVWSCATAVPLNPDYTTGELAIHFRDFRADAVLVGQDAGEATRRAAGSVGLPILRFAPAGGGAIELDFVQGARKRTADKHGDAQSEDIATILATSGTTSHSKIVPLHHRVMLVQIANYIRMHELTPDDRCLSLMPLFHGHGINSGICGPLCSGGSTSMLRPFDIDSFARCIETLNPTWYTGSYTFHHQILAHADRLKDVVARSRLRFARSGSGRLDGAAIDRLERALSIPHIQAYSSSETGLIASNPMPPAPRKPDSVGAPADAATTIVDDRGRPLPAGERGEVAVAVDKVFGGYENDPPANRAAFRSGWYRTGDEGYFDADGYLFLTGRIKEVINRGGEKIAPTEVEAALLAHPGVQAAAVFPIPHATLGEEVAAAIVWAKGVEPTEAALTAHLRTTLADFKAPRRYVFVDSIPYGPTGRVVRRQLAGELGVTAGVPARDGAAADGRKYPTALEAQLQTLWAEALRLDSVGLDDDFFLLGGDSLQAVELFLSIEAELGQRLPRAILFEAGTVASMARRIAAYSGSPCLVPIVPLGGTKGGTKGDPKSGRPPFFCIHGSDGNAVYFRDLGRHLDPSQPFYALQSVGLDGLEEPLTRIEDIVARYLSEIRGVQPNGPYYIGGFSFGGRVAYVMAQRLSAAGEEVALLALLDTFAHSGEDRPGIWRATLDHAKRMTRLPWRELPGFLAKRGRNVCRVVAMRLPQPVFALMRGVFSDPSREAPRSLRLSPYEAHGMASRAFVPTPYEGDAVLFSAVGNRRGRHDGWARLIKGKLEVHDLSGGHYDILGEPQVRVLARELGAVLAERQARYAPRPQHRKPAESR